MNKIKGYVLNGKGIGAFVLFALAFAVSVYFAVILRSELIEAVPLMQDVADKVLPIEIKNGVVLNPENTVKVIDFNEQNHETDVKNAEEYANLPVLVIDTTQDTLDTAGLKQGLYLSRTTLYAVKTGEVRVIKLQNNTNLILPKQDYTEEFKTAIKWTALLMASCGTVIAFLVFLILTVFYAYLAGVAAWINKTTLAFDVKMRLSSVLFAAVYIIAELADAAGFPLGVKIFALLMFALQIITIRKFNNK